MKHRKEQKAGMQFYAIRLYFEGKRFPITYQRYAADREQAVKLGRIIAEYRHPDRRLVTVEPERIHR